MNKKLQALIIDQTGIDGRRPQTHKPILLWNSKGCEILALCITEIDNTRLNMLGTKKFTRSTRNALLQVVRVLWGSFQVVATLILNFHLVESNHYCSVISVIIPCPIHL